MCGTPCNGQSISGIVPDISPFFCSEMGKNFLQGIYTDEITEMGQYGIS